MGSMFISKEGALLFSIPSCRFMDLVGRFDCLSVMLRCLPPSVRALAGSAGIEEARPSKRDRILSFVSCFGFFLSSAHLIRGFLFFEIQESDNYISLIRPCVPG